MTTINTLSKVTAVNTKGAVETVLPCCTTMLAVDGSAEQLDSQTAIQVQETVGRYALQGLRILAGARRTLGAGRPTPPSRETAEQELTLLGLIGMADPP